MVGRSVPTPQRRDREGVLEGHRSPIDRRYYAHGYYLAVIGPKPKEARVVAYVRVSGAAQAPDLTPAPWQGHSQPLWHPIGR